MWRGPKSCHREKANVHDDTNYATSRLGDDRTGLGSGEAGGRAHADLGTHHPGCRVWREMRESWRDFLAQGSRNSEVKVTLLLTRAVVVLSQRSWGLGERSSKVPFRDGSSHLGVLGGLILLGLSRESTGGPARTEQSDPKPPWKEEHCRKAKRLLDSLLFYAN